MSPDDRPYNTKLFIVLDDSDEDYTTIRASIELAPQSGEQYVQMDMFTARVWFRAHLLPSDVRRLGNGLLALATQMHAQESHLERLKATGTATSHGAYKERLNAVRQEMQKNTLESSRVPKTSTKTPNPG